MICALYFPTRPIQVVSPHEILINTSALMARMAVGAVNIPLTLCWLRTRKNAPGSGVPTGLPWKTEKRKRQVNKNK